jgi:hypothetical protein
MFSVGEQNFLRDLTVLRIFSAPSSCVIESITMSSSVTAHPTQTGVNFAVSDVSPNGSQKHAETYRDYVPFPQFLSSLSFVFARGTD